MSNDKVNASFHDGELADDDFDENDFDDPEGWKQAKAEYDAMPGHDGFLVLYDATPEVTTEPIEQIPNTELGVISDDAPAWASSESIKPTGTIIGSPDSGRETVVDMGLINKFITDTNELIAGITRNAPYLDPEGVVRGAWADESEVHPGAVFEIDYVETDEDGNATKYFLKEVKP